MDREALGDTACEIGILSVALTAARADILMPEASDTEGFDTFPARYKKALPLERTATEVL